MQDLSQETGEPELADLLAEDIENSKKRLRELESSLLVPLSSLNSPSVGGILEVRAGTGGEEASLFAKEVLKMYQNLAAWKSWKWELLSLSGDHLHVKVAFAIRIINREK